MAARTRVLVTGIATETHGFNKYPTTLEAFTQRGLWFIQEHESLERYRGDGSFFAGYLDVADAEGWELVTGLNAFAWPAGPVTEEAFETLWARIEAQLKAEGPFDALLLALHGGMACANLDDPEGEFVARVRRIVGRQVPIGVTLDPHCNLSPGFVRDCDVVCAMQTTPHVDGREAAARTARLVARTLRGEIRPRCHSIHPPMLAGIDHGRTTSPDSPMLGLKRRLTELQAEDSQLLDGSFMACYPHADQRWTGPSAVLVMDGAAPQVHGYLDELGAEIWRTREVLTIRITSIAEALEAVDVTASDSRPFLLGDFSDCPYAGGYGDGTALLAALIERRTPRAVFGPLFDADAVAQAQVAGVGAEIEVALGGRCDPRHGGGPLHGRARVHALSDGRFVHRGAYMRDMPGTLGPSACLDLSGVLVVVNTFPSQIHDREQLRLFGIEAVAMNVIASKAFNHMRADFEPISRGLLYPDSGGIFSFDLTRFPYQNVRRPIWPLDRFDITPRKMDRC